MHNTNLFSQYVSAIRSLNLKSITDATAIPKDFLLGQDGGLTTHYIPFDVVNPSAKVVLVGITPGFTQWKNAMREAQRQMLAGATLEAAHSFAKRTGSFSGSLRPNLVALLDAIGMHQWLKLASCADLFDAHFGLVHTTSILRHPVFVDGKNYSGTPSMIKTPFLQRQILEHFANEVGQMDDPVYIPLGPKVSEGLAWLSTQGGIRRDRILDGLPHPSGANAERIAYFLGRKPKHLLSAKTNAGKLDAVRTILSTKVAALR